MLSESSLEAEQEKSFISGTGMNLVNAKCGMKRRAKV
jgi:hypothetical protein